MVDAEEFIVADIQPFGFIIEILDEKQKPLVGIKLSVAIDNGNKETVETDKDGVLKIPKPKGEIKLSLVGEEISTTTEESEE